MTASLGRFLRHFHADQRGNVLMLVGVCFVVLVAIGGAGYDFGRQQVVRLKMQQAADAAALAGAGMAPGTSDNDRRNMANLYFSMNYPQKYLDVPRPTPTITVTTDANITVTASSPLLTSFIRTVNVNTLTARGRSVALIKSDYNKVDLILVMDNSGSMSNTDVNGNISNSLNGSSLAHTNCLAGFTTLGYGPVPFPIPPAAPYCYNNVSCCNTFEGVTGFTRLNALRYSATQLTNAMINPNPNNHRIALVTWDSYLMNSQNFSTDPNTVKNFLNQMYGRAATDSGQGLTRAQDLAKSFRPDAVHAVVLMTDGVNGNAGSTAAQRAALNAASLSICSALKNSPRTLVFTVAFGSEIVNDPVGLQFLSDCATGPNGSGAPKPNQGLYYFPTSTADDLQNAFIKIVGTLQKVRIVQ